MNSRIVLTLVTLAAFAPLLASAQGTARGVVFNDRNGNGTRDSGEPGIARVCVSNAKLTSENVNDGRYIFLPIRERARADPRRDIARRRA